MREDDVELQRVVNEFFRAEYRGRWYNITRNRYFGSSDLIRQRQTERTSQSGVVSPFDELFRQYASEFGFDWRLLAAQSYEESRFDPEARSRVGAMGLMQIMPQTARGFGFDNPDDPDQAVHLGALYLRHQADQFGPEVENEEDLIWFALASYKRGVRTCRGCEKDGGRTRAGSGQVVWGSGRGDAPSGPFRISFSDEVWVLSFVLNP